MEVTGPFVTHCLFFGYFTCICVDGRGPCVYLYACEFMYVVVVVVAVAVCVWVGSVRGTN